MEDPVVKEGKTLAIVSYITIFGTLIAFVLNQNKHNSFAAFHIRQGIGLALLSFIVNFIERYMHLGWLTWLLSMGVFVLYVIGIIGAIQGKEQRIPLLGDQFQEWFRNFG